MAQDFPETYRPGKDYPEELERIFGKKIKPCGYCQDTGKEPDDDSLCRRGCEILEEKTAKALDAPHSIDP